MPTVYKRGVAKNIVEVRPTSSVLVSNNRYCHPADSIFVKMLFIQVSLKKWLKDKGNRARSRARVDYIIICAALHPWTGLLSQNLKHEN